jgi:hypothetical protein
MDDLIQEVKELLAELDALALRINPDDSKQWVIWAGIQRQKDRAERILYRLEHAEPKFDIKPLFVKAKGGYRDLTPPQKQKPIDWFNVPVETMAVYGS